MNKQELIKKLKELLTTPSELEGYDFEHGHDFGIERAIALAEQLDEPEKPVFPKYVADWIEWCKKNNITFLGACTAICDNKNIRSLDASGWATKNQETFAKAWFYGYEVDKEKPYKENDYNYRISFPGYEISYRPYNGPIVYTDVVEDPECLRMEIDLLLEQYNEVTVRKKS